MDANTRGGNSRLILYLAIAALFIYTNPDEKMHLDFVRGQYRKIIKNVTNDVGDKIVNLIASDIGDEKLNSFLKNYYKRKNFVFFSLTEEQFNGKSKYVGFGVLGNLFPFE